MQNYIEKFLQADIERLTKVLFSFSFLDLDDQTLQEFSNKLAKCYKVSSIHLNLDSSQVSNQGLLAIGCSFPELPKLQRLDLRLGENQVQPEGIQFLCQGIAKCQSLTQLTINQRNIDNFDTKCAQSLGQCLAQSQNLTKLTFISNGNDIGAEGLMYLSKGISNNPKLKRLIIKIGSGQKLNEFVNGILPCKNLKNLELQFWQPTIALEEYQSLVVALSQIANLKKLRFTFSDALQYEYLVYLLDTLSHCEKLKHLYLSVYELGTTDLKTIQIGQGSLKNLQNLTLQLRITNEENMSDLLSQLEKMEKLKKLNLQFQKLFETQSGATTFSSSLAKCNKIQELDISFYHDAQIQDEDEEMKEEEEKKYNYVFEVFQELKQLVKLKQLFISILPIGVNIQGFEKIGNSLAECSALQKLYIIIQLANLQDEDAIQIGTQLTQLTNLSDLNLNFQNNKITEKGASELLLQLPTLKNISALKINLSHNSISEQSLFSLTSGLQQNEKIRELDIAIGPITIDSQNLHSFLSELGKCKTLRVLKLHLYEDCVNMQNLQGFISGLQECPAIYELKLDLYESNLTKEGQDIIAKCLRQCRNLYRLVTFFQENEPSFKKIVKKSLRLVTFIL